MPVDARRGMLFLLISAIVTLSGDLIVISFRIWAVGISTSIGSIVRWLLTLLIFYLIWRGYGWARWLLIALLSLGLLLILRMLNQEDIPLWLPCCLAIQFLVALVLLLLPRGVAAFLEYQRASPCAQA
jgi:hypothetical protein